MIWCFGTSLESSKKQPAGIRGLCFSTKLCQRRGSWMHRLLGSELYTLHEIEELYGKSTFNRHLTSPRKMSLCLKRNPCIGSMSMFKPVKAWENKLNSAMSFFIVESPVFCNNHYRISISWWLVNKQCLITIGVILLIAVHSSLPVDRCFSYCKGFCQADLPDETIFIEKTSGCLNFTFGAKR